MVVTLDPMRILLQTTPSVFSLTVGSQQDNLLNGVRESNCQKPATRSLVCFRVSEDLKWEQVGLLYLRKSYIHI